MSARQRVKVSVIIPVYNGASFIEKTIQSVLSQTFQRYEILIVNDCSTDSTINVLEKYKIKENIKIITNDNNLGQAASINIGIKESIGEYIAHLDADDLMLSNRLDSQVKYLDKYHNLGLVHSEVFYKDKTGSSGKVKRNRDQLKGIKLSPIKSLLIVNTVIRSTMMHRRSCIEEIGFFDQEITGSDEYDFSLRIAEKFEIKRIKARLGIKVHHGDNISVTRSRGEIYYLQTHVQIIKKSIGRGRDSYPMKILLLSKKLRLFLSDNFFDNVLGFKIINRLFYLFDWTLYPILPNYRLTTVNE